MRELLCGLRMDKRKNGRIIKIEGKFVCLKFPQSAGLGKMPPAVDKPAALR